MSCDPLATPPPFGPPRAQPGVPAPQPRPAVQVRRMDVTGQRVVVNDRAGETRTGTVLMQLWKGSHTLYCWHDTTTGADELADEVAGVLAAAAHVVGPPAGVTLHPAQIGATDDKMAQAKGCCVPVSVGWEVPRLWLVRQEGRGLRMAVRPARRLG